MSLDTGAVYKKFDPEDVGYGIEQLPEQIRLAWHDTRELIFPASYSQIDRVVVAGMGGSSLGAHAALSVLHDRLSVPVTLLRDYELPKWADKRTAVILSSFSGTTEEVLAVAKDAKKRGCKLVVSATGGDLEAFAVAHKLPAYIFHPGDLAKQPRFATGFSFVGMLGIFERLGICKIKEEEIMLMANAMSEVIDSCAVDVPLEDNPAKQVATALKGKLIVIATGEHLAGVAHTLQNHFNETSKQMSFYVEIPEMNHHLLESFVHPGSAVSTTSALMLRSALYHERVQKRFAITADLLESAGVDVIEYESHGTTLLEEAGEVLQFGSYVGWYLAMLNKVNTTEIPYVKALKERMAK